MGWGLAADGAGMSRGEKRAALLVIQGNACAVCGAAGPDRADHDHDTGLLRGMLCKSCNVMEGKTRLRPCGISDEVLARFDAYRAKPPAGKVWFWDFPDDWSAADTAAVRQLDVTLADYVLTVRTGRADEQAAADAERIAIMQQRQWAVPT